MQFNCWEHCKILSQIANLSCTVFVKKPVTDNCLALDMSISLYENYIMLNHTSPFTNGALEAVNGQSFYVETTS